MNATLLDIIFCLVGIIIIAVGAKRGFFKSLMNFIKVFLAFLAAKLWGTVFASWIAETFPSIAFEESKLPNIISYLIVFIVALLVLSVLTIIIKKMINGLLLVRVVDIVLGGVFGFVAAFLLLMLAASVLKNIPSCQEMYGESVIVRFIGDFPLMEKLKLIDFKSLLELDLM